MLGDIAEFRFPEDIMVYAKPRLPVDQGIEHS